MPYRQWVLSVPKRVRWHMQRKPEVTSALLRIFLRAVETPLRQDSPDAPGSARFGAVAFDPGDDVLAVQKQMRHRGLRWLLRHGHLDAAAIHVLDTPEHAGGWSVDASVNLPAWDRQGLERLSKLVTPPRLHKHRTFGVLAPNAKLRKLVIESAGPAAATLQLLQEAHRKMGLEDGDQEDTERVRGGEEFANRWVGDTSPTSAGTRRPGGSTTGEGRFEHACGDPGARGVGEPTPEYWIRPSCLQW